MSERGVQPPGVQGDPIAPSRRPGPPARRGGNPWQVVAIIAIVAATAGWTAAGILAFREPSTAAVESPTDSFDPNATDDSSIPPVADTHDAPELEAFLPTERGPRGYSSSCHTGPWSICERLLFRFVCPDPE